MAGGLSSARPTVLGNVGVVLSKTVGPRRGEPISVIQALDAAAVMGGLAVLASMLGVARRWRTRH